MPKAVFDALASDGGRASFWAESAARDAMSLYVSASALEQSLVRQRLRHQDQEWVLSREELIDRFTALPAEKFPQTQRHAAELISGTGHDRFEFALGLLMNNLRPASG